MIKKRQSLTDNNPPIKYIFIKSRTKLHLKLNNIFFLILTYKTIKLPGSTENKRTKDKNGEIVPRLDITGIKLVHCDIVSNDYQ